MISLGVKIISIPLWYDWYAWQVAILAQIAHFNSTLVRLIREIPVSSLQPWTIFQFHFGTIDTVVFFAVPLSCVNHFNSTLVRLILRNAMDRDGVYYGISIPLWYDWYGNSANDNGFILVFQFHFGTIDTYCVRCSMRKVLKEFQFHFGTIDTSGCCRMNCYYVYFNSTLVRLIQNVTHVKHWNNKFQFHFGTIDTRFRNSWGVYDSLISIPLWYDWYFGINTRDEHTSIFQFHFGTIDTKINGIVFHISTAFQFHFGTIDTTGSTEITFSIPAFQFHFGTIDTRCAYKNNKLKIRLLEN